ncbi:MAG: hypothetical protein QG608_2340 [Actinomycetota bacterium]|nr:hypothetical protein [Actinomycetota bacterium]
MCPYRGYGSSVDAVPNAVASHHGTKVPSHGVEVRRSRRRVRTVTAYREGPRTVILIPARFSPAQEQEWVNRMVARLSAQDRRRRPPDAELMTRARELSRRYLDGLAQPVSVSWVGNQNHRWGSCTPADRTIRISTRLRGMPQWVTDYVLLHELAHLLVQGHGPRFWALLERYPRLERARGYLDGFAAARDLRIGDDVDDDDLPEPPTALA